MDTISTAPQPASVIAYEAGARTFLHGTKVRTVTSVGLTAGIGFMMAYRYQGRLVVFPASEFQAVHGGWIAYKDLPAGAPGSRLDMDGWRAVAVEFVEEPVDGADWVWVYSGKAMSLGPAS